MSYDISWYLDKRIILVTYHETLTIDELPAHFETLNQYRDDGEAPVHILTDMRRLEKFPMSLTAIRQAVPALNGFGVDVLIGMRQPVIHFMISVVTQFSKLELRQANSIEDALVIIARLDPTLTHLMDKSSA